MKVIIVACVIAAVVCTVFGEEADPRWTAAADQACARACGCNGKAVPNFDIIDVEKCDSVDCKCSNGRKAVVRALPDGSPCIKYMIVTPPPRPQHGVCQRGSCRV